MSSGIFHERQMAYVGAKPWHGLGFEVQDEQVMVSSEEFLKAAHCDWNAQTDDIFDRQGTKIPGQKVTYADIEGSRRYFGVVSDRYEILQNKDAFAWFQPWLDAGLARFETGGYLNEGQKVWALARLNLSQQEVTKGDMIERFAMLSNSHDGTNAVRVGFTDIRIVCANTLSLAHRSEASQLIRVRHSKMVKENVEKLREIMDLANQEFVATVEQFRFLNSKEFNQKDLTKFVKVIMDQDVPDEDMSTRGKNLCEKVISLIFTGKGQANLKNTWWKAYNGFTEYLTWEAGRSANSRLNSLWFGKGQADNQKALKLATQFAEGLAV